MSGYAEGPRVQWTCGTGNATIVERFTEDVERTIEGSCCASSFGRPSIRSARIRAAIHA